MRILKIKPNDNLFFGSGKRFEKDESTWLSSKLIPYPSVFYGAVASLMLSLNRERSKSYIYNKDNKSDPRKFLKIKKIYLCNEHSEYNKEIYIPCPLDLFIDKRKREVYGKFRKLEENFSTSVKELKYFLFVDKKDCDRGDKLFINRRNFYNTYIHTGEGIGFLDEGNIATESYKIGIQKDENTAVSKEGHLYRIDLTEFKDGKWSYLVEYEICDTWWNGNKRSLDCGYLKLGGENKSCKYYDYAVEDLMDNYNEVGEITNKTEYVKLYFSTPAIFNSNSSIPCFNNDIEVLGTSLSKPYYIGGFDVRKKRSKCMYKAVPEGAVYLLKCKDFQGRKLNEIRANILNTHELINYNEGFGQFDIVPLDKM